MVYNSLLLIFRSFCITIFWHGLQELYNLLTTSLITQIAMKFFINPSKMTTSRRLCMATLPLFRMATLGTSFLVINLASIRAKVKYIFFVKYSYNKIRT
jgi:hypothetical protein